MIRVEIPHPPYAMLLNLDGVASRLPALDHPSDESAIQLARMVLERQIAEVKPTSASCTVYKVFKADAEPLGQWHYLGVGRRLAWRAHVDTKDTVALAAFAPPANEA